MNHLDRFASLFVIAALVSHAGSAAQAAPKDRRELAARESFAAGRYTEALDLYAKLYAEKLHPVYLRNIGRCYQNLGEPDKAIISFRDYLRKSKSLQNDERQEIDGYIKEMEALKAQRETAARPVEPSSALPAPSAPSAPLPGASAAEPPPAWVETVAAPDRSETPALYTRWWFWTAVAGVAVLGVVGLWAGGVLSSQDLCTSGRSCE